MGHSNYDKMQKIDTAVDRLVYSATGLDKLTGEDGPDFYELLSEYPSKHGDNRKILASVAGRLQFISDQMMLADGDEALMADSGFLDLAAKRDALTDISTRLPEPERRDFYQMKAAAYTLQKMGYDGPETNNRRAR